VNLFGDFLASIEKFFITNFVHFLNMLSLCNCVSLQHDWSVLNLDKHLLILGSSIFIVFHFHSLSPTLDVFLSSFFMISSVFSSLAPSLVLWSLNLFRFSESTPIWALCWYQTVGYLDFTNFQAYLINLWPCHCIFL